MEREFFCVFRRFSRNKILGNLRNSALARSRCAHNASRDKCDCAADWSQHEQRTKPTKPHTNTHQQPTDTSIDITNRPECMARMPVNVSNIDFQFSQITITNRRRIEYTIHKRSSRSSCSMNYNSGARVCDLRLRALINTEHTHRILYSRLDLTVWYGE